MLAWMRSQEIAATPQDSDLRFVSRKDWPAFAKRLREVSHRLSNVSTRTHGAAPGHDAVRLLPQVGPAAPVVASVAFGNLDKEATLSEEYGGKAGNQPGVVDRVYIALGKVLTISGRTIRPEAQASPTPADDARLAIEEFLSKVRNYNCS